MTSKVRRLLAELLAGCEVPRSMGVLGMAAEAFDALYDELHLSGYPTADEIKRAFGPDGEVDDG
jgi:hypothetical protein